MSNLLEFQENIDALWSYWSKELHNAKRWKANDEGWIRCHPEEDIASRKGFIRILRRDLKRRKASVKQSKKRIAYCEAMLREVLHTVDEVNEARTLPTN